MRQRAAPLRASGNVGQRVPYPAGRRGCERPVTAEPARVISVMNPWAWRIVAGLEAFEHRTWKPSWRGRLWIHASKDGDLSAPAELWPPAGQLVSSAIIGHVTLADVEGRPGAWRWVLTSPYRLARPVTGVPGHPGLWLIDLPPRLSAGPNAPR
jgi:ASCH domain